MGSENIKVDLYRYDYLKDIETRVDALCEWICRSGSKYIEANSVLALFNRESIKEDGDAGKSDGSGQ